MSSQKGNTNRTRPQKYKNATAFKNTKYDTSQRTKGIINTTQDGLCERCKEKIEWKIKYKKYKPLTQPATCVRCHQKTVKKAYYTVCQPCATRLGICAKCAQPHDSVTEFNENEKQLMTEKQKLDQEIQFLSERERRTYLRQKDKCKGMELLSLEDDKNAAESPESDEDDPDCDSADGSDVEEKIDSYSLFK